MKILAPFFVALIPALLAAAEPTGVTINVRNIPAGATELVAVIDITTPPPAPEYQDPAAPPPVATTAVKAESPADPTAAPAPSEKAEKSAAPVAAKGDQPRGRRGRRGANAANAAPAFQPLRRAIATEGQTSVTINVPLPARENYQVRVIALRGTNGFPVVLAGARLAPLAIETEKTATADLALKSPELKLAPDNPASVAPGAHYTLTGRLTDAARSLGAKNRMRVWMSGGAPPRENYAGAQISTIDVKPDGDDVIFNFALTAPSEPTTLYFQFGEIPGDFARADGTQAAFIVRPDLAAGEASLTLRVQ